MPAANFAPKDVRLGPPLTLTGGKRHSGEGSPSPEFRDGDAAPGRQSQDQVIDPDLPA
jgi:hypothetical protein